MMDTNELVRSIVEKEYKAFNRNMMAWQLFANAWNVLGYITDTNLAQRCFTAADIFLDEKNSHD
jgi:hypothetical protein